MMILNCIVAVCAAILLMDNARLASATRSLSSRCLVDYFRFRLDPVEFVSVKLNERNTRQLRKFAHFDFDDHTVELALRREDQLGRIDGESNPDAFWHLEVSDHATVTVDMTADITLMWPVRHVAVKKRMAEERDVYLILPQSKHILRLRKGRFRDANDIRLMNHCNLRQCTGAKASPRKELEQLLASPYTKTLNNWKRSWNVVKMGDVRMGCSQRATYVKNWQGCNKWLVWTYHDAQHQRKFMVFGQRVASGHINYVYYNPSERMLLMKKMDPELKPYDGRVFYYHSSRLTRQRYIRHVDTGVYIKTQGNLILPTCDIRSASDINTS